LVGAALAMRRLSDRERLASALQDSKNPLHQCHQ
jgi:hypothetical protein